MRSVILLALPLLGCATRAEAILALDGDAATGEPIYQAQCASCHGAAGEGGVGPRLDEAVPEHSDEALVELMLTGIGDEMPSAAGREDQELADLFAHLRLTHGEYEGDGHDHEH